jgi:hypothetical protein
MTEADKEQYRRDVAWHLFLYGQVVTEVTYGAEGWDANGSPVAGAISLRVVGGEEIARGRSRRDLPTLG